MRLGTYDDARRWFEDHQAPWPAGDGWPQERVSTFALPVDSGRKTALARLLVQSVLPHGELGLLIDEYGVWPSSENQGMFMVYRRCIAGDGALETLPFQIGEVREIAHVEALFALSLYFMWGAVLASDAGLVIRTSHDKWLELGGSQRAAVEEATRLLSDFGLSQLVP